MALSMRRIIEDVRLGVEGIEAFEYLADDLGFVDLAAEMRKRRLEY